MKHLRVMEHSVLYASHNPCVAIFFIVANDQIAIKTYASKLALSVLAVKRASKRVVVGYRLLDGLGHDSNSLTALHDHCSLKLIPPKNKQ